MQGRNVPKVARFCTFMRREVRIQERRERKTEWGLEGWREADDGADEGWGRAPRSRYKCHDTELCNLGSSLARSRVTERPPVPAPGLRRLQSLASGSSPDLCTSHIAHLSSRHPCAALVQPATYSALLLFPFWCLLCPLRLHKTSVSSARSLPPSNIYLLSGVRIILNHCRPARCPLLIVVPFRS